MQIDFVPITADAYEVGEGPVYDDRINALYFCDILAGMIHRVALGDGAMKSWNLGGPVGSFGLAESGRLVVAVRHTVGLFDIDTGNFDALCHIDPDVPETRLNDGKVGPDGAFWVGSLHEAPEFYLPPLPDGSPRPLPPRKPIGFLFRVAPDGSVTRLAGGYRSTNGLAFSPDGRVMYHADTSEGRIDRWRLDPATGEASDRQHFATVTREQGIPDGAAMDVEGHYWAAGLTAACLNRFAPDGRLVEVYPVPVGAPTMPCFGGPDMRTLFVTSLRHSRPLELLERYPLTGRVIAGPSPVAGFPVARFKDA